MRRFLFGMAIATMSVAAPMSAVAEDRDIADAIVYNLKQQQTNGSLRGFDINLNVEGGTVTFTGKVANEEQLTSVLKAARSTPGVRNVVNQIQVAGKSTAPKPFALAKAVGNANYQSRGANNAVVAASSNESDMTAPDMMPEAASVSPEDALITEKIIGKLSNDKASGTLKDFELDVSTVDGEVWVRGYVATAKQKQHVLQSVQRISGVRTVVDDITVNGQSNVRTASNERVVGSSMPVAGGGMAPRAFAPSMLTGSANAQCSTPGCGSGGYSGGGYGGASGGPMAMGNGPSYGGGVPRYDQPNMPNHAWPSYAAYPNYAAVTYPKQYSASAWPYIGPFYPYPQVPLGWRKVTLEWDDGMWYLDYSSK